MTITVRSVEDCLYRQIPSCCQQRGAGLENMGDGRESERKPLLPSDNSTPDTRIRGGYTDGIAEGNVVNAVGPDEMPPSYHTAVQGSVPMVTCRVCQAMIDISGRRDQHVVKCTHCKEATPIRNAPPGKKYVRCPCNCLLICKNSSLRIACPRPNCKQIINLAPSPVTPPASTMPGMCSVVCAHCHGTFLFNTLSNALARCPYCRKVSSVGPDFATRRSITLFIWGLVFLLIGIGVTVGTYEYAKTHGGMYVAYVGPFIVALFLFWRTIHFCTMKVSVVEGTA